MAKLAKVVDEKGLVPQDRWKKVIDGLKDNTKGSANKENLKQAIIEAIKKRLPKEHFGLFFSGGVDSSLIALICKQLGAKFTCYTVGFKSQEGELPNDVWYARKIAENLGLDHVEKVFNLKEASDMLKKSLKVFPLPKPNLGKAELGQNEQVHFREWDTTYFVTLDVASVVIAAKSIAKERVFFSGLGSEEIFAGYKRHEKSSDINEECWKGLKDMWSRDLYRDVKLGGALKIDLLVPFLDEDVITEAMKFSGEDKIKGEHKKAILREIAEEMGLPKEFAWRKKQGAQYGSKFDVAIEKLRRMNGFETKREYVESLAKQKK